MKTVLKRLCRPTGGRKRKAASLFCALVVTAGLVMAADNKPRLKRTAPKAIEVTARVLSHFDKTSPNKMRFGRLAWRGGVELSSPSKHFGGWSGLALDKTGRVLLAISDAGTWLRAKLTYHKGHLSGLTSTVLGPLKALNGTRLAHSRDRDAEAISLLTGSVSSGLALIAFEQNDRVGVFPLGKKGVGAPRRYLKLPNAIRKNRRRNGLEALTVLRAGKRKGTILTFLEGHVTKDKRHRGWLLGRGKPKKIWLQDIGGFSITDLASLPDGGALVLERRFRWSEGVKMRLRYLSAKTIKPQAYLTGEVLLEADMKQQIDNMEGLAVHQNAEGETVVTLISDDNFNAFFQRTVMLQFALDPKTTSKAVTATGLR